MQGTYTVIAKGKAYKNLSFLTALQRIKEAFESSPDKAVQIEMYREHSR